jgi:hypothetical protein
MSLQLTSGAVATAAANQTLYRSTAEERNMS